MIWSNASFILGFVTGAVIAVLIMAYIIGTALQNIKIIKVSAAD